MGKTPYPDIRKHLLWEYNIQDFDFDVLATVAIERVIERGNLDDWREILRYYGHEKILETSRKSPRLDEKNKNFTPIILNSGFLKS